MPAKTHAPDWADLKVFLAVARARRLELAAPKLDLDATTVGRRLVRLEQVLGATLFERTRTGHVLTQSGRRLLRHVERMEQSALAAVGTAGAEPAVGGHLRVSASESFGTWFLAPHVPAFRERWPTITLDVVASGGFLNPSRREADVAIMLARPARGPLVVRRLVDYRLGLYAAVSYLERSGRPRTVASLRTHSLVGFVPDLIHVPEQRLLEEVDPGLIPVVRSTSVNAQVALIRAGAGAGVLPKFVAVQVPELVPVLGDAVVIRRSFWLVVHRDVRRTERVDAFVKWLDGLIVAERKALGGE